MSETKHTPGTDAALVEYLKTGETGALHKNANDGGVPLPWIGGEEPSEHAGFVWLHAMPATRVAELEGMADIRAWLLDEVAPIFEKQLEYAGAPDALLGPATILRDPYSAKPYILFYVSVKAFKRVVRQAEHTQGPVRFHDTEANTIVAGHPGEEVCNTLNGFGDQRANAEFIIRAWNSHDEMLAELETSRCPGGGWNGMPADIEPTVENCMAAGACGCSCGAVIAKARGQS